MAAASSAKLSCNKSDFGLKCAYVIARPKSACMAAEAIVIFENGTSKAEFLSALQIELRALNNSRSKLGFQTYVYYCPLTNIIIILYNDLCRKTG